MMALTGIWAEWRFFKGVRSMIDKAADIAVEIAREDIAEANMKTAVTAVLLLKNLQDNKIIYVDADGVIHGFQGNTLKPSEITNVSPQLDAGR